MDYNITEKFSFTQDLELQKRAGFDRLVTHNETPRFIGRVNMRDKGLRLIKQIDNLEEWAKERITAEKSAQNIIFELFSEMIEWAENNEDKWAENNNTIWSPLPITGFILGKPATMDDLKRGDAYFVLENANPIDIIVPQYAHVFDNETNEVIPCIVLQAEEAPTGDKAVAFMNLRTREINITVDFEQLILLGQNNPAIQPSEIKTPPYEGFSKASKNLSALVSVQSGITGKRDYIKENQSLVNTLLHDAFNYCSPIEFFTLLDCMKSLVSRDSLLKMRAKSFGHSEPSLMFHSIDVTQVCSFLTDNPEICIFSIYQSPEQEFFGFFIFVDNNEVRTDRFPIATGSEGLRVAKQLRDLINHEMWKIPHETEFLLNPLLDLFGSSLIPRVQKLTGPRKMILIPHRWTHILPLHMMTMKYESSILTLDDFFVGITYSSSLTSFKWINFRPFGLKRQILDLALVCVDIDNLGQGAQFEIQAYRNMFADAKGAKILTSISDLPNDLSTYPLVLWSSHATSDPTNWERNRLLFQSQVFSAERISNDWDLRNTQVAILAACETGIDLSVDDMLDEYYGLDMAFHIAGCSTVISTMWKVEDNLAGYTAVQLLEGCFLNQPPSSHLRIIRHLYKTGNWYKMAEMAYQLVQKDTSASKERQVQRLKGLDYLLQLPKDSFNHPSRWGVFRSFGRW